MANNFIRWISVLEKELVRPIRLHVETWISYWKRASLLIDLSFCFWASSTSCVGDRLEDEAEESPSEDGNGEESSRSDSPLNCSGAEARSQRADSEATDDDSEEVLDTREKFLIFTMGSRTYTPHQIGKPS